MKKFAAGGDAAQTARYARKTADIESDYQKALKAGRSSGIAKAKYEQRMADAADDLAKWTRSDRTQTRAAESAAEKALSEARRTKGVSALRSQTPAVFKSMMDEGPIGVTPGAEVGRVASPSTTRATRRPRAAAPPPRRDAPTIAPRREAPPPPPPASNQNKPTEPKNEEIVVTGNRQKSTAGDPAYARYRMGQAMAGPAKFALNYLNPLGLAANMLFPSRGGEPAKPAAPRSGTLTAGQNARMARLKAAAEAPGASQMAKDSYRYARESNMVGSAKGGAIKNAKGGAIKKKPAAKKPMMKYAKGGAIKKKPAAKKPMMKYAKGGSIDGCAIRGKTRVGRK